MPTQSKPQPIGCGFCFQHTKEGFAMDNKGGRVVFMPDIEYRAWVNRNRDMLEQIVKDKQVSTVWLRRGQNKAFLIRYFEECGYTITID
jgi:ferredoxin